MSFMNSHFDAGPQGYGAWMVVNTHANQEAVAERNLINQGYEPYLPIVRKQVRHAGRTRDVLRPLFPSYLFVRHDRREMRWRPILSTIGVRAVVRHGDKPSFMPECLIADLKLRETDGVITRPVSPRKIGETVHLARGPFNGLAGKIIELGEKDRLIVLMAFLNQQVKVAVSADQLAAN
jgi:transcriptional antiterminator RfaH